MTIAQMILLHAGEGKSVSVVGDRYVFKAASENTGGAYGLFEMSAAAGAGGPPPHVHEREDEAFYILEGELQFTIGDETVTAGKGAFLFAPRGIVHSLRNRSDQPAKALVIVSPGGFEKALQEMAQAAPSATEPPDMDRLLAIAARYGLKIVGPG